MSELKPRGLVMGGSRMIVISLFLLLLASSATAQELMRPADWSDASHGNLVPANYDLVLPDDRINETLHYVHASSLVRLKKQDMVELNGERGTVGETAFGVRRRTRSNRIRAAREIAQLAAQLRSCSEEAVKTA